MDNFESFCKGLNLALINAFVKQNLRQRVQHTVTVNIFLAFFKDIHWQVAQRGEVTFYPEFFEDDRTHVPSYDEEPQPYVNFTAHVVVIPQYEPG